MAGAATLGLIGKHPGYGDFLRAGLSDAVASGLEQWLDAVLSELRDEVAGGWPEFWDNAQELRFWLGSAVLGRCLIGVLRPMSDRTGRRYPLILAAEGTAVAPPVQDADQGPYDILAAHLDVMQPGQGASALLAGLTLDLPVEESGLGPTLWAHHPTGDLAALLRSAAAVDASRAQLSRSYWWASGGPSRAAVWLGCPGLPGAQALGWLLTGVASEGMADEQ